MIRLMRRVNSHATQPHTGRDTVRDCGVRNDAERDTRLGAAGERREELKEVRSRTNSALRISFTSTRYIYTYFSFVYEDAPTLTQP